jgi:hypothetical protein
MLSFSTVAPPVDRTAPGVTMIPGAMLGGHTIRIDSFMSQLLRNAAGTNRWKVMLLAVLAGCASTPDSAAYDEGLLLLAERPGADASSAAVADGVVASESDFVILAAERDSAWFAEVAAASGLLMSGPAIEQGLGFAYLASREPLGDTTIAIPVGADGAVVLHDALYELSEGVFLDLIAFRADGASDLHALIQSFLAYMATDVMASAPLVLGIQATDDAVADSLAVLLRPSFQPPAACGAGGANGAELADLRLFIGTPAQIACKEVGRPPGEGGGLLARLVLLR